MNSGRDQTSFRYCFRHMPELTTDRLLLRPVRLSDAREMFTYSCDPEVSRYVLWEPHRSIADTYEAIFELRRQYRRGEPATFAIVLRHERIMIGTIGFMWLNAASRSAEIGYSLSRRYWNCGYMTEALTAVLGFAFQTLHLHRVEAQHDIQNPASGRVMQKAGMRLEGTLRDRLYMKGRFVTVCVYSILQNDLNQEDGHVYL